MDADVREKIANATTEKGFSVKGFSRRDFVIMLIICQEVLLDDDLLATVNPLGKFKGSELELTALAEKINRFLD